MFENHLCFYVENWCLFRKHPSHLKLLLTFSHHHHQSVRGAPVQAAAWTPLDFHLRKTLYKFFYLQAFTQINQDSSGEATIPVDCGLKAEGGMGEWEGETLVEMLGFCCSMSSSSRPLAAALCLLSSRRRCSTLLTGRMFGDVTWRWTE